MEQAISAIETGAAGGSVTTEAATTPDPQKKVGQARVFMGFPTYLGRIEDARLMLTTIQCSKKHLVGHASIGSSANCFGFNQLWVTCLEQRKDFTHFLLHHSDIVPEQWYLDKMVEIMERTGADILSVVSPIKDHMGFTSTALDEPVGDMDPRWRVRRLTMKEIFERPATFTDPKLLINTGLMLVDIRKPWVDKVHFHFDDDIIEYRGRRLPIFFPEDWNFSRDARKLGASIWATREVSISHMGQWSFKNDHVWGSRLTDSLDTEPEPVRSVLDKMEGVEGWFSRAEGLMLYDFAKEAVKQEKTLVEIGSWKGRSTVVLGSVGKLEGAQVYAIDPHEGDVTVAGEPGKTPPTFEFFKQAMKDAELEQTVTAIRKRSTDVEWTKPIGLLLIDGLHDFESVKQDFRHFERHVVPGGYVLFHDYNEADVKRFVDTLPADYGYSHGPQVGLLKVMQKSKVTVQ